MTNVNEYNTYSFKKKLDELENINGLVRHTIYMQRTIKIYV